MMHDFICCEVLPENGLTSTDVETPQHTLLYGPLYASVHPAHLSVDAVQLQCKTHSTALDVFTGCGGALATAPIPLAPKGPKGSAASSSRVKAEAVLSEEQRQGKILQAFKTVINIDTCSILYVCCHTRTPSHFRLPNFDDLYPCCCSLCLTQVCKVYELFGGCPPTGRILRTQLCSTHYYQYSIYLGPVCLRGCQ